MINWLFTVSSRAYRVYSLVGFFLYDLRFDLSPTSIKEYFYYAMLCAPGFLDRLLNTISQYIKELQKNKWNHWFCCPFPGQFADLFIALDFYGHCLRNYMLNISSFTFIVAVGVVSMAPVTPRTDKSLGFFFIISSVFLKPN